MLPANEALLWLLFLSAFRRADEDPREVLAVEVLQFFSELRVGSWMKPYFLDENVGVDMELAWVAVLDGVPAFLDVAPDNDPCAWFAD